MLVKQVLYSGKSKFQEVDLIDVGPFGKVGMLIVVADQLSTGQPGYLRLVTLMHACCHADSVSGWQGTELRGG